MGSLWASGQRRPSVYHPCSHCMGASIASAPFGNMQEAYLAHIGAGVGVERGLAPPRPRGVRHPTSANNRLNVAESTARTVVDGPEEASRLCVRCLTFTLCIASQCAPAWSPSTRLPGPGHHCLQSVSIETLLPYSERVRRVSSLRFCSYSLPCMRHALSHWTEYHWRTVSTFGPRSTIKKVEILLYFAGK